MSLNLSGSGCKSVLQYLLIISIHSIFKRNNMWMSIDEEMELLVFSLCILCFPSHVYSEYTCICMKNVFYCLNFENFFKTIT